MRICPTHKHPLVYDELYRLTCPNKNCAHVEFINTPSPSTTIKPSTSLPWWCSK